METPARFAKLVFTETILSPLADQQPFHRGVGEVAHVIGFERRAALVADIEPNGRKREANDGEADAGHP